MSCFFLLAIFLLPDISKDNLGSNLVFACFIPRSPLGSKVDRGWEDEVIQYFEVSFGVGLTMLQGTEVYMAIVGSAEVVRSLQS